MGSTPLIPARSKSVVITGASSGLGKAAARHLADLGYRVFAGVRSETSTAELSAYSPSAGELIPVMLDVTEGASIAAAGDLIERRCADTGLWAVVNNAGISIPAPLECLPVDAMRKQLETNVIGAHAVAQRFLPLLRASHGRIINISSGIGSVTPPYLGAYATSQFAKEGFSDALRRELRPLQVSVTVIQPGAVGTQIWDKMNTSADEILAATTPEVAEVYRGPFAAFMAANEVRAQTSRTTADDYARTVAKALAARRPKIRYRVGADARSSALARRIVPDRLMDVLIAAGVKAMTRSASRRPGAPAATNSTGP